MPFRTGPWRASALRNWPTTFRARPLAFKERARPASRRCQGESREDGKRLNADHDGPKNASELRAKAAAASGEGRGEEAKGGVMEISRELIVGTKDLDRLSIRCKSCGAELVIS